jgi:hypothetical protein
MNSRLDEKLTLEYMPIDEAERALFERMTRAQEQMSSTPERMADAVEKQQSSKPRFLTMFATMVTAGSSVTAAGLWTMVWQMKKH